MMKLSPTLVAVVASAAAVSMAAFAQGGSQTLDGGFTNVKLQGGGDVRIEYSEDFRFENTGDADNWKLKTKRGELILGCENPCIGKNRRATVYLPRLEGTSIQGGGRIAVEGNFPSVETFDVAIQGGGQIDADDVEAKEVNAAIMGGGQISVWATSDLDASVMGGGQIRYKGDPEISKSVLGGGGVSPL